MYFDKYYDEISRGDDLDDTLENSNYDIANMFVFPNQTQYWKLAMFLADSANASISNS